MMGNHDSDGQGPHGDSSPTTTQGEDARAIAWAPALKAVIEETPDAWRKASAMIASQHAPMLVKRSG